MNRYCAVCIAAVICFGTGRRAAAIAVNDYAVAEAGPANAGYALDWNYVYKYKNASAVAVDHYWILTAAHVGDDGGSGELNVNGEIYTQQEVVLNPTADLALVRYDKPFPGYYALMSDEIFHKTGRGFFKTTVWHDLIMVGYGFDGTVSSSSFTQGTIRGIRRWGTNKGVSESTVDVDVGGTAGVRSSSVFQMNFNLSDTPYEAGGNVYDSGGAVFATNSLGNWVLAGINVYRSGTDPFTGNTAVKVADYVSWIKSVIVDYDTDMDGLPDWWEVAYGQTDANADPDGDGFTNYEEWLADSNPTNAFSLFDVTEEPGAVHVIFSSSSNRVYQLQAQDNLASGTWSTVLDWFPGSSPTSVVSVAVNQTNRFYRVQVKLP